MLQTIHKDAELSNKQRSISNNDIVNYILYQSDITIGNNCIQVLINQVNHIYFSFNTFNSMSTSNHSFCQETDLWIKNLISKSTQISGISEKLRYQFFNKLYKKVDLLIKHIQD